MKEYLFFIITMVITLSIFMKLSKQNNWGVKFWALVNTKFKESWNVGLWFLIYLASQLILQIILGLFITEVAIMNAILGVPAGIALAFMPTINKIRKK